MTVGKPQPPLRIRIATQGPSRGKDGGWGSVIIGLALRGGVILWINMKRAVSTEECHSEVKFMHRRSTTYCENGPLQMDKGRNKDGTKNVMVQQ